MQRLKQPQKLTIGHTEILNKNQINVLPEIYDIIGSFNLVLGGGTALALQFGHRHSIDFDFFAIGRETLPHKLPVLAKKLGNIRVIVNTQEELSFTFNNIKITFLAYPFKLRHHKLLIPKLPRKERLVLRVLTPLDIAVSKAYALGRRAKWKDYVDLYFLIFKYGCSLSNILNYVKQVYQDLFSEQLFLSQLCYFDDIDYSEQVDFVRGFEVSEKEIKNALCTIAKQSIT